MDITLNQICSQSSRMDDYVLTSSLHLTQRFTEALPRPQAPREEKRERGG